MIPVSVVTGFLGSGKTTLIGRALRNPAFGRTAVIVNDFGEVALDHDLIASSDDSVLTLSTGCLCCSVQSDLAQTLADLHRRRDAGLVDYDRVLIETSGLADPAPMLLAMIADRGIFAMHRIAAVVTLVDTVHGEATLHEHVEARHQVALADQILFSKTDLQPPGDRLLSQVNQLNPAAARVPASRADLSESFDSRLVDISERLRGLRRSGGHSEIETFAIIRERPLPALALTMLLQAIAEHCGSRLLRLKGLIAVEELPGQPAVIHGVRHAVSPPEFLARWPSEDERTRMVFISKGIPRYLISRLLDAIEWEVRDAREQVPETADPKQAVHSDIFLDIDKPS